MIETMSLKIASRLQEISKNEKVSKEVITFGLIVLFNTVTIVSLCFFIGLISGQLIDTMLALLSFSTLRMLSGGYHLNTPLKCITASVVTMCAIPYIPLTTIISYTLTSLSILLVLIYAPSNINNQTRIPEKYHFLLKILSLVLVSINLLLNNNILSLAFFVQSLSLIRIRR